MSPASARARRRTRPALPLLLALLCGSATRAAETPAAPEPLRPRSEVTLGAAVHVFSRFPSYAGPLPVLEAAYHHRLDVGAVPELLRLGAGVRVAPRGAAAAPLEGYVRLQLVSPLGPWQPALGPELGYSGLTRLTRILPGTAHPNDGVEAAEPRTTPFYMALAAAPLRFQLARLTLSAAEVHVGTELVRPGSTLRLQLGLLSIGGVL
jgi:hypothetical protein